jgi:hypothetical protein
MKLVAIIVLSLASVASQAEEPNSWFRNWPHGSTIDNKVSANLVVEIPHSLFEYAQGLLKSKSLSAIGDDYLPGFRYSCPGGTNTYLVRALYEHPANGVFQVFRFGDALLVRHYALGAKAEMHRSVLLVCLSFEPKEVYIATGGAM